MHKAACLESLPGRYTMALSVLIAAEKTRVVYGQSGHCHIGKNVRTFPGHPLHIYFYPLLHSTVDSTRDREYKSEANRPELSRNWHARRDEIMLRRAVILQSGGFSDGDRMKANLDVCPFRTSVSLRVGLGLFASLFGTLRMLTSVSRTMTPWSTCQARSPPRHAPRPQLGSACWTDVTCRLTAVHFFSGTHLGTRRCDKS